MTGTWCRKNPAGHFTDPYPYKVAGREVWVATGFHPVLVSGKFAGIVALDYPLEGLQKSLSECPPVWLPAMPPGIQWRFYASHPNDKLLGKRPTPCRRRHWKRLPRANPISLRLPVRCMYLPRSTWATAPPPGR